MNLKNQNQGGYKKNHQKIKVSKKKCAQLIKKDKNTTEEYIQEKLKENCIIMSEEEYNYLNQQRDEKPRLCCQTHFVIGQLITQPESTRYEFKMFSYPFVQQQNQTIKRTIVSFLNSEGGFIFIGIKQVEDKKRFAAGMNLCQGEKQQIYKEIRRLVSEIQPNIVTARFIETNFIPIKYKQTGDFIAGRYVIKLTVGQGDPQQLYSFKSSGSILYYLRYHDECILISKFAKEQQILRRKSGPKYILQVHKCLEPQIGFVIHHSMNKKSQYFQKQNNVITSSVTFIMKTQKSIQKLRTFIGKTYHNLIFLGPRSVEGHLIKLELSKWIQEIDVMIQSFGGKLLEYKKGIKRDQTSQKQDDQVEDSLDSNNNSNSFVIQGWEQNKNQKKKSISDSDSSTQQAVAYQNQTLKVPTNQKRSNNFFDIDNEKDKNKPLFKNKSKKNKGKNKKKSKASSSNGENKKHNSNKKFKSLSKNCDSKQKQDKCSQYLNCPNFILGLNEQKKKGGIKMDY